MPLICQHIGRPNVSGNQKIKKQVKGMTKEIEIPKLDFDANGDIIIRWEQALVLSAFVFVSLSPTDICPRFLREQLMQPYVVKVVPCILIWVVVTLRLFGVVRKK
jgi:hypothetical protein